LMDFDLGYLRNALNNPNYALHLRNDE